MKTGIDVLSMTPEEFNRRRRLINNLAWTIAREGIPVMAPERLGYGSNRNDDEEDLNYQENVSRFDRIYRRDLRGDCRLARRKR